MTNALKKLTSIGTDAIRQDPVSLPALGKVFNERTVEQLGYLLTLKNGLYAFEGALHVLSDLGTMTEKGVIEWNSSDLWRKEYQGMADQGVFFAEDAFGAQFCIRDGEVTTFDPETGSIEHMATDLEGWAEEILRDYDFWTGHSVALAWQLEHGPIPIGARLAPITPFVMGGEFAAKNVNAVEAVESMKARASVAVQIRNVPDGTPIKLRVTD